MSFNRVNWLELEQAPCTYINTQIVHDFKFQSYPSGTLITTLNLTRREFQHELKLVGAWNFVQKLVIKMDVWVPDIIHPCQTAVLACSNGPATGCRSDQLTAACGDSCESLQHNSCQLSGDTETAACHMDQQLRSSQQIRTDCPADVWICSREEVLFVWPGLRQLTWEITIPSSKKTVYTDCKEEGKWKHRHTSFGKWKYEREYKFCVFVCPHIFTELIG